MFKSKKIASLFLFGALLGGTALSAQTMPAPQQQQQTVEVNDEQLSKFADAFMSLQVINQEAQQKMAQVVQDGGLEIERFNQIYQSSMDPQAAGVEATAEEQAQYAEIVSGIEKLQISVQADMEKAIASNGISTEEYERILTGLQSDTELQERLRAHLQE